MAAELVFYIGGYAKETFASDYGIRMGQDFIEALTEPLSVKDLVTSESRLESGKRVLRGQPIVWQSRDVTLTFVISGKGNSRTEKEQSMWERRNKLIEVLSGEYGYVGIAIPKVGSEVYWLRYLGKSNTYALALGRTVCNVALKFNEPNPAHRSSTAPS
ncbi:MAG: hypothetical protein K2O78_08360 [Muribaculaceae bacterium]|nr:hypothetical protein [Muribaculaceae bacterium]